MVAGLRADAPGAVVLTGSGGFFSGGVDLKLAPTLSADEQRGMVAGINRMFADWYGFPGPVVAAVNGHAVAGGLILALCADHRVGVRGASYGLTELRVGAPYPVAALAVVRAELDPGPARRLVLGAALVDGEAALADWSRRRARRAGGRAGPRPRRRPRARGAALRNLRDGQGSAARTGARGDPGAGSSEDPLAEGWLSDETGGRGARGARGLDR